MTQAARQIVLKDVMVPMRDGVRLAADVYLPAPADGGEPQDLPALLTRTPYSRDAAAAVPADPQMARPGMADFGHYFASHGYAVADYSHRGPA